MKKKTTAFIAKAAIIAAIYFVTTICISPLAFGQNQIRLSEALNVLVYFTPAAIPGLTAGCLLANLASPFGLLDIIGGSAATFMAATIASKIKNKYLVGLPCVISNALIVGFILSKMLSLPFVLCALSIGVGQGVSVYLVGLPLIYIIEKNDVLLRFLKDK